MHSPVHGIALGVHGGYAQYTRLRGCSLLYTRSILHGPFKAVQTGREWFRLLESQRLHLSTQRNNFRLFELSTGQAVETDRPVLFRLGRGPLPGSLLKLRGPSPSRASDEHQFDVEVLRHINRSR